MLFKAFDFLKSPFFWMGIAFFFYMIGFYQIGILIVIPFILGYIVIIVDDCIEYRKFVKDLNEIIKKNKDED